MIGRFARHSAASVRTEASTARPMFFALHEAQEIVSRLPEEVDGQPVRCHEIARVVHAMLGHRHYFEVVDGKYGPYEHTWLASRRLACILDTYAIGRFPIVQLVSPYLVPHLYAPGRPLEPSELRPCALEKLLHHGAKE